LKRALYGYFGEIVEHNENLPGHPLYQLNFLDSLSNAFNIDTFDILHYTHKAFSKIEIQPYYRTQQRFHLLGREYYPEGRNVPKIPLSYDLVILKHRFHNRSRIEDQKGLDCEIYEQVLQQSLEANIPVYIVDSDDELCKESDFFDRFSKQMTVLTFACNKVYPDGVKALKISPTSDILIKQVATCLEKKYEGRTFSFDGNNYLKGLSLTEYLEKLGAKNFFTHISVFGKGWYDLASVPEAVQFPRSSRSSFYYEREHTSMVTLNITKSKYEEQAFVSPRIIEGFMFGEYPFCPSGYHFMPDALKFQDFIEFYHKAVFYSQNYSINELVDLSRTMLENLKKEGFIGITK